MKYGKGVLGAVAAILLTSLGFELWTLSKIVGNSKAIGIAALGGIALETLASPLFWVIAASLFAFLFAAGRVKSKPLRVILFWIPVTGIWIMGLGTGMLFMFIWLHFRQG